MTQINFKHDSSTLGSSLGLTEKEVYIASMTTKFVHLQPLLIVDNVFDEQDEENIPRNLTTVSGLVELLDKCVGDNKAMYSYCLMNLKGEKEDAHLAHIIFTNPEKFKEKIKNDHDNDSDSEMPLVVKLELFMMAMKKKFAPYQHTMNLIKETGYDYNKFITALDSDENLKFVPESEKPETDLPGFLKGIFGIPDDSDDE